jgi:hypothetical protein
MHAIASHRPELVREWEFIGLHHGHGIYRRVFQSQSIVTAKYGASSTRLLIFRFFPPTRSYDHTPERGTPIYRRAGMLVKIFENDP